MSADATRGEYEYFSLIPAETRMLYKGLYEAKQSYGGSIEDTLKAFEKAIIAKKLDAE